MITIGETTYSLGDPVVLGAIFGLVVVYLLIMTLRRAGRAAEIAAPLASQMSSLGNSVQVLADGQKQLNGGLTMVSDTQANAQAKVLHTMETRLGEVQRQMAETLHDNAMKSARSISDLNERLDKSLGASSEKTTKSLTQLQERLATIDKAQTNIEKLSGDVLSLQDILSNKQRRGMFGEIQLNDIVDKALPADSFTWQATLSNGKRADCLIHLTNPPGPIVIDAKFPLEPFEKLAAAQTKPDQDSALREFAAAVRVHINAISDKYIIEGETADGALMFLPSEAVYAELHAKLPEVVRAGFEARVWIVSPTTCMATLNTMRAILKDARMREQAGAIRKELGLLAGDVERLGKRVGNLDKHFSQAAKDVEDIKISATKAENRARKLDRFEFDEVETTAAPESLVTPKKSA